MALTREDVVWGYRLILAREPESEEVIQAKLAALNSVEELRRDLLTSPEFRSKAGLPHFRSPTTVIHEIGDGLRLFVDLSDTEIGMNIVAGSYEPNEQALVRSRLFEGDIAIDVGANIGFFTMLMASQVGERGHVYAFEPLARNASLLERSVTENLLAERVTATRAAVGAAPGEMELISPVATNNWGGPYLRTGTGAVPPNHETTRVPVLALDSFPMRRPIRFVKLDAEGAEMLVLSGARNVLREDRPAVMTELNPKQLAEVSGCSVIELITEMAANGYDCFTIGKDGPGKRLATYAGGTITNVVFLPV